MDGLEELLAEVEAEAAAKSKSAPKAAPSAASPSSAAKAAGARRDNFGTSTPLVPSPADEGASARTELAERLKRLHFDLADPAVREALHVELAAVDPQGALEYYRSRPALAQYTLEQELARMTYAVAPREGGEAATAAAEIAALYASDAARREAGEDRGPEVLWRMANQSLFAGALEVVHRQLVMRHDDGGVLCLAATTERAEFHLDMAESHLRAVVQLSLSTLSGAREGQGRLGLASIGISVEARVSQDGCRCLSYSQAVEKLQPEFVFEEQFAAAAAALAELDPNASSPLSKAPADDGNGSEAAGFASVRAATALGAVTASALGAAATVSASALGAATQGLRSLSFGGGVGGSGKDGPAVAGESSSGGAGGEFDDLFESLGSSTPVSPPQPAASQARGQPLGGSGSEGHARKGEDGKSFAGLFDRIAR